MPDLPLLLGEAPSRTGDRYHAFPLSGAPAKFVCDLLGIRYYKAQFDGPWWRVQEHFEVANLIERYPGPQGRGAAFPMAQARDAWSALMPTLSGRVVVLLGIRLLDVALRDGDDLRRVAIDAAPTPRDFYVWRSMFTDLDQDMAQVVAIPHPSGLNRMYNDPAEKDRARATLREAIARASR